MWTGMMARVRGVTAAAAAAGSSVSRSGSMSAKTGRAPVIMIASAEYAAESGAVITSSPGPMPTARSASASASVPVPTPIACAAPDAAANSRSNASSSGPSTNQPRVTTRSIASRTSAASTPGFKSRNGIMFRVLAPHHQRVPELEDVDAGPEQAPEVEELRLAVGPMIVVHRHFGDAEPRVGDLLHHLQADDAAVLLEVHPVEDRPPHHAEVAVDVAHGEAEEDLDGVVVDAADDDAVQRIGAADLVAVDEIDLVAEPPPQHFHLGGVVLRVAVGVEDELPRRGGKAGAQRAAVAAVRRMVHDADLRIGARELVEDLGGVVGAAVVDDDHFEVGRELARGAQRRDDEAGDGTAVVVGRKEDTQTLRGSLGCHGKTINLIE